MEAPPYAIELGDTLIDADILENLEKLWVGNLKPEDLDDIELGLRALLTGRRLISSPDRVSVRDGLFGDPLYYKAALGDTCLHYEFIYPDERAPLIDLQQGESDYLEKTVLNELKAIAPGICTRRPSTMGEAADMLRAHMIGRPEDFHEVSEHEVYNDFLDDEYVEPPQGEGYLDYNKINMSEDVSLEDDVRDRRADARERKFMDADDERIRHESRTEDETQWHASLKRALTAVREKEVEPFERETFVKSDDFHYVAANMVGNFARYFIACHRSGLTVYANSPIGKVCNRFIFSDWPRKLFEGFDEEYANASRQLRAPGISVDLPPMVALVLSRAGTRDAIPELLRDMREEYSHAREDLWRILREMWTADRYESQLTYLRQLQAAADSLYPATFPERVNRLSLGLGLATGSFNDVGKKLLEHDQPMARVAAVSMAARLSQDFRKLLANHGASLRHHLTRSERRAFGIG